MKYPSSTRILSEAEAFEKLHAIGEERLLRNWEGLESAQKESLLRQISHLDIVFFHRQQEELLQPQKQSFTYKPFTSYFFTGNPTDFENGKIAVKEGKCACIVLAGGQGSRLRCEGPKGCVPITNVKRKTLFQHLAGKIRAASIQAGIPLQIAIMTSPLNHVETEHYFVKNAFFGLDPRQLTFFYQRMWPFLNFDGHLFLQSPDQIARGPNGNGGMFRRFVEIGLWQKWQEMGIEIVNIISVDNPLALPFDHELIGFQKRLQSDAVVKTSFRKSPEEKVGIVVNFENKPAVIEYSELIESQNKDQADVVANLGMYSFTLSFIKKASESLLPLHRAKKSVKQLLETGEIITPETPNAWKFEEFIFDVLPLSEKCEALLYPRETIFAPLKNFEGEDSIETVQAALLAFDQQVYARITGKRPPEAAFFELSPSFYYPTDGLLEKWRGKPLPDQEYIDES